MTFVLVSVVYAVAVGEPSFGNVGPFAVGLALFSMVFAGELTNLHCQALYPPASLCFMGARKDLTFVLRLDLPYVWLAAWVFCFAFISRLHQVWLEDPSMTCCASQNLLQSICSVLHSHIPLKCMLMRLQCAV